MAYNYWESSDGYAVGYDLFSVCLGCPDHRWEADGQLWKDDKGGVRLVVQGMVNGYPRFVGMDNQGCWIDFNPTWTYAGNCTGFTGGDRMNLPIDVVVELLMANYQENGECGHESDMWIDLPSGATISDATSKRLRTKVREYLLTLVPKPVLLSECEEYKGSSVNEPIMVYRVGKCAYRSEDNRWYGYADMCQVIQPVEVPHEAD